MDPDPTPDPTPFFTDYKDTKKKIFFIFCSYNLPTGKHLQSKKLNLLLKFCIKILFCGIVIVRSTHLREKEGSGSIYPNNGSGSGRPKNVRILRIRIPNTVCCCSSVGSCLCVRSPWGTVRGRALAPSAGPDSSPGGGARHPPPHPPPHRSSRPLSSSSSSPLQGCSQPATPENTHISTMRHTGPEFSEIECTRKLAEPFRPIAAIFGFS
jgi:hypothetical protein